MKNFYKTIIITFLLFNSVFAFSQIKVAIYNSSTQVENKIFANNLISSFTYQEFNFEASDKTPNINYLLRNQGQNPESGNISDEVVALVCDKLGVDYVVNFMLYPNKTKDNVRAGLINAKTFSVEKTVTLTCENLKNSANVKATTDEIAENFLLGPLIADKKAKEEKALAEQKAKEEKALAEQQAKEEKALAEKQAKEEKALAEQQAKAEKALAEQQAKAEKALADSIANVELQKAKEEKWLAEQQAKAEKALADSIANVELQKAKEEKWLAEQQAKAEKALADSIAKEKKLIAKQSAKEERKLANKNLNGHYISFGSSTLSSGYYGLFGIGYEYRYHILGINASAGVGLIDIVLDVGLPTANPWNWHISANAGFKLYWANKVTFLRNLYFNFLPFCYFGQDEEHTSYYTSKNNAIIKVNEYKYEHLFGVGLFFGYSPVWNVSSNVALGINMDIGIKANYKFEKWCPLNWDFGFIVKFNKKQKSINQ